ncbi:hypothetical protein RirG_229780 [Rhizophagus irregularis DAOM 197198w]|uniref:Uncharacterized protein n=1 Tax=Rhizophagus irregularis (strain DAOM 197198w) TaxID=1432141 RepID=A0A015ICS1_RHIIW|nr:hypothetical protein RirG_229780 [Rhizophagus irregularis DAOM 197198w]
MVPTLHNSPKDACNLWIVLELEQFPKPIAISASFPHSILLPRCRCFSFYPMFVLLCNRWRYRSYASLSSLFLNSMSTLDSQFEISSVSSSSLAVSDFLKDT